MTGAVGPMQIVFRTDASLEIGTGHVMRCLTLAAGFAAQGAEVRFFCRAHDGNLIDLIKHRGFMVHALSTAEVSGSSFSFQNGPLHASWLGDDWQSDVEQCVAFLPETVGWLIVDHYALDYRWENAMREKCHHIMVIDDLADRAHDCDVLLDQSLGRTAGDYRDLVGVNTRQLLGPRYALLRPEFCQWRATSLARRRSAKLRHILVTMGGSDRDNVTGRVLQALAQCSLATLEKITVILGPHATWIDTINVMAANMQVPTSILYGVDNMAELMTSCDLAIGAGGATTWERCSLGVPSILIVLADNQLNISRNMSLNNAAFVIEDLSNLEISLTTFLESCELSHMMEQYIRSGAKLTDACGASKVIADLVGNYGQ